jgi:septal ring factor EnvC (AmiA/AmiB activator)
MEHTTIPTTPQSPKAFQRLDELKHQIEAAIHRFVTLNAEGRVQEKRMMKADTMRTLNAAVDDSGRVLAQMKDVNDTIKDLYAQYDAEEARLREALGAQPRPVGEPRRHNLDHEDEEMQQLRVKALADEAGVQ